MQEENLDQVGSPENPLPVQLQDDEQLLFVDRSTRCFETRAAGAEGGERKIVERGAGALVITSDRVVWVASDGCSAEQNALEVDFLQLTMHAVSRDTSNFSHHCVFCVIDTDNGGSSELRFVPEDAGQLDAIFSALCTGAEMNPDPSGAENLSSLMMMMAATASGQSGLITADSTADDLSGAQKQALQGLDSLLLDEPVPGQFEDADE